MTPSDRFDPEDPDLRSEPGAVPPSEPGAVPPSEPGAPDVPPEPAPGPVNPSISAAAGAVRLTPRRDWIVLRIVIAVVGLAIVAAGVWGVIAGTGGIWGVDPASRAGLDPTVENDHAFLSAALAGVGLAFLWVALALDRAAMFLAALCGIVFLGGIARVLSWAIAGTPYWSQILLMIGELVIPPLLLLWHGWIRRTQKLKASFLARSR